MYVLDASVILRKGAVRVYWTLNHTAEMSPRRVVRDAELRSNSPL